MTDHEKDLDKNIAIEIDKDFIKENLTTKRDAGEQARTKLTIKAKAIQAAVVVKRAIICSFLAVLIVGGVAGNDLYQKRVTKLVTDERPCSLTVGDNLITGKRTYSYKYTDIAGLRFIDTDKVEEKTTLNVEGTGFTVIGMTNDNWGSVRIGHGEQGIQVIKNYDVYTFVFEDAVNVVPYGGLCK